MKTILVVEDDAAVRRTITKMLHRGGHRCIQASNGRLAYEVLMDNPDIALIVTDINMPELDGAELIDQVRSNEEHTAMPILAISGTSEIKNQQTKLQDGPSRLVIKPISRTLLLSEVQSLLNRTSAA